MRSVKLLFTVLFIVVLGLNASAQKDVNLKISPTKTDTFKVWGNCSMCKARIEKAVKADGAVNADWNIKSKMLTVTFDPSKTNVDAFSKKLAQVGHDTEKYKADNKVYDGLDACCHYERAK
jgi:periplasmic mercuric ion binding protein